MPKYYLSKAQILSRLTIALRARSPEAILPDVIASVSEAIQEKDRATEYAMTDFCAFYQPHVIAEGASLSAIYGLLRRVAPRNDVKCAALSLAALKDFVCEANGTYVHLVRAMPKAAQKSFACFFFFGSLFLFAPQLKRKSEQ